MTSSDQNRAESKKKVVSVSTSRTLTFLSSQMRLFHFFLKLKVPYLIRPYDFPIGGL